MEVRDVLGPISAALGEQNERPSRVTTSSVSLTGYYFPYERRMRQRVACSTSW
jgi:hypothetical protein